MLHRNSACRSAVHRQLRPSDSIWVSESLLFETFQRFFALSRSTRRHGSFVPGPLESRRRMGKRRMAHISEASPQSANNIRDIWGWFGESDRTQWQWEAPTPRAMDQSLEPASELPAWLLEWKPNEIDEAAKADLNGLDKSSIENVSINNKDILDFRQVLQDTIDIGDDKKISEVCKNFNIRLRQSLKLGLVDIDALYLALEVITDELHRLKFSNPPTFARSLCLHFYRAVWHGINTCKVIQPTNLHANIIDKLLGLVASVSVPMTRPVRIIARSILSTVSTSQMAEMDESITRVILAWSHSWTSKDTPEGYVPAISAAENIFQEGQTAIQSIQSFIQSVEAGQWTLSDVTKAQQDLVHAEASILSGMKAVRAAESLLLPFKSMDDLVGSFENIRHDQLRRIIGHCSKELGGRIQGRSSSNMRRLRHYWLSMVARIPDPTGKLLPLAWQSMPGPIHPEQLCHLIIDFWECQGGYLENLTVLRNKFEASNHDFKDVAVLIMTIEGHVNRWTKAKSIFDFLKATDRYETVYRVLGRTIELGMIPPMSLIRQVIETMSEESPLLALRIFDLYVPKICSVERLKIEQCPSFMKSLIRNRFIPPKTIWRVLDIPLYAEIPDGQWPGLSKKPMNKEMAALMCQMATDFAHSPARPQRVALRNVMQCLYHLRRYRIQIPSELTRALTWAGVTRKIISEHWVSTERAKWVLGLVEKAEGEEVMKEVDTVVYLWRQRMIDRRRLEERRGFKKAFTEGRV